MSKKKYSTTTISNNGEISPWLAFSGELAYTPESPPLRDYFFQYGWILPSIIDSNSEIKRHYYFGYPLKDGCEFLFDFWNKARNEDVDKVVVHYGRNNGMDFKAPIAIYRCPGRHYDAQLCYLFIQHGSYQLMAIEKQPFIDEGNVVIYRGIGKAKQFRHLEIEPFSKNDKKYDLLKKYFKIQEKTFSDSELSFKVAHDRVVRCQTGFLVSNTGIWEEMAHSNGLDWRNNSFARHLADAHLQSYSLNEKMILYKFGPNYAKCITSISNIRLTTFFAGENEVKIIDPRKVDIIETKNCTRKAISV